MTPSEKAARGAVNTLIHLLKHEKAAIAARAFSRIRQFAVDKRKLLATLEGVDARALSPAGAATLAQALAELNRKASENAAALAALREGMSDARRRLDALAADSQRSGLYSPRGGDVRANASGSVTRSA